MTVMNNAAEVRRAALGLVPKMRERAAEVEALGTMPADLVAEVRSARLFRLLQPAALGGLELEPLQALSILSMLCQADASSGWTVIIGAGGNAFTGWLEPSVARDVLGSDADVTVATVFAPTGRAVSAGRDRVKVSGWWPFASGCRHAEWLLNGVLMMDGDRPRMLPDRGPDWRLALFNRSAAEIVGDWDASGLQGTGSNDVGTAGVEVSADCLISPFFEPARQPGPLWLLPFFTLAGVALVALPLGVGRRALEEFAALAPDKGRAGAEFTLAHDPAIQVGLAHAEGRLNAAQAFVEDAVGALWDAVVGGDVPTVAQRARFQLAAQEAMSAAVGAADFAFGAAGAGALKRDHPLARCFRDIHAAAQHAYFSPEARKRYAKVRLGIEQPLHML